MELSKGMYLRMTGDLELANDYGTYFTIGKGIVFVIDEIGDDSSCQLTSVCAGKTKHQIWLTNKCIKKHFERLPVGEEAAYRL
jgi:hypothetical protein